MNLYLPYSLQKDAMRVNWVNIEGKKRLFGKLKICFIGKQEIIKKIAYILFFPKEKLSNLTCL